jgi:hypothetical protein
MTEKFPGVFTTKYPYSCTFDSIATKVSGKNNKSFNETLSWIKQLFTAQGVDEEDISICIKQIRDLGTTTSHPCTMVNQSGNEYVPSADEMRVLISEVNLARALKDDALKLLHVLEAIVPVGTDLLYSV